MLQILKLCLRFIYPESCLVYRYVSCDDNKHDKKCHSQKSPQISLLWCAHSTLLLVLSPECHPSSSNLPAFGYPYTGSVYQDCKNNNKNEDIVSTKSLSIYNFNQYIKVMQKKIIIDTVSFNEKCGSVLNWSWKYSTGFSRILFPISSRWKCSDSNLYFFFCVCVWGGGIVPKLL